MVVYDAVRRALAHPPRAASHRPAELDKLGGAHCRAGRLGAVQDQLHIHHTALEAL